MVGTSNQSVPDMAIDVHFNRGFSIINHPFGASTSHGRRIPFLSRPACWQRSTASPSAPPSADIRCTAFFLGAILGGFHIWGYPKIDGLYIEKIP